MTRTSGLQRGSVEVFFYPPEPLASFPLSEPVDRVILPVPPNAGSSRFEMLQGYWKIILGVSKGDNMISLRRMKSEKAHKNSHITNPERVERSIAPGVNPGFGVPMIPGTPKG
jgi:hypothetical protein